MAEDTIVQLVVMVLAAAVTYGAIRQDLKNIHEKIARTERDIDKAHERIDGMLTEASHARKTQR